MKNRFIEINRMKNIFKERFIEIISISLIGKILINLLLPIFLDVDYYVKNYNSYVYTFIYDNELELSEQIEHIKEQLNIENRIETVMVKHKSFSLDDFTIKTEPKNVIVVLYSDENIYNVGFYDVDEDKYDKVNEEWKKYINKSTEDTDEALVKKITPKEVFILVATEYEGTPRNYLSWQSATYERAYSALKYRHYVMNFRTIERKNGLYEICNEYDFAHRGNPDEENYINNIQYVKTIPSILYHIARNLSVK